MNGQLVNFPGSSPGISFNQPGTPTVTGSVQQQQNSWAQIIGNIVNQAALAYTNFLAYQASRNKITPPSLAWPYNASHGLPNTAPEQVAASSDRTQIILLGVAGVAVVGAVIFGIAKK